MEKRWDSKEFSQSEFKDGTVKVRAQMAFSLIKGKSFVGRTTEEVKNTLGNFTGYFWSNSVPAYLIDEGWTKNLDSWQIVFLIDDSGKVKEVKVHKNCCN